MAESIIKQLDIPETSAPMILVIGETGAGKSHFINKLAGKVVVKESARLHSCTKRPELVEVNVGEHEFLMIDTPGFNDTWKDSQRSDGHILAEISRTLTLQSQMGVKLRGILFLYDIGAPRMTGDKRRQIEMIKYVCGQHNFANVLLVTTHWPQTYEEENEQGCGVREADLRTEFWKDMIKGGSKMLRFYNDEDGAQAIVASLAERPDITLALQEEMAAGKALDATVAGAYIVNARQDDEKLLKQLKAKTKDLSHNPQNAELVLEIEQLQQSVESRKASEAGLKENPIARVRNEIRELLEEARRRRKQLSAPDVVRWLLTISEFTVELVQTVLSAT